VLTGVFASLAVNAIGAAGGMVQFGRETVLALAALVFPFVMTFIILWFVDKTIGLRVSDAVQDAGLDFAEHGEFGYDWMQISRDRATPSNVDDSVTEVPSQNLDGSP
jgi:ammonia channel protein AmtB